MSESVKLKIGKEHGNLEMEGWRMYQVFALIKPHCRELQGGKGNEGGVVSEKEMIKRQFRVTLEKHRSGPMGHTASESQPCLYQQRFF